LNYRPESENKAKGPVFYFSFITQILSSTAFYALLIKYGFMALKYLETQHDF